MPRRSLPRLPTVPVRRQRTPLRGRRTPIPTKRCVSIAKSARFSGRVRRPCPPSLMDDPDTGEEIRPTSRLAVTDDESRPFPRRTLTHGDNGSLIPVKQRRGRDISYGSRCVVRLRVSPLDGGGGDTPGAGEPGRSPRRTPSTGGRSSPTDEVRMEAFGNRPTPLSRSRPIARPLGGGHDAFGKIRGWAGRAADYRRNAARTWSRPTGVPAPDGGRYAAARRTAARSAATSTHRDRGSDRSRRGCRRRDRQGPTWASRCDRRSPWRSRVHRRPRRAPAHEPAPPRP